MTATMNASMNNDLDSSLLPGSFGARRATDEPGKSAAPPDPQVAATAPRRRFSAAEKQRILEAADRCTQHGELGALLRRERIYSSLLSTWRKQRREAQTDALAVKPR